MSGDVPFARWIGREATASDQLATRLVDQFRATLDPWLFETGGSAPLGIHWCLCPPLARTIQLDADGHPPRGDFLPPIGLPRRMWAAGELEFLAPLRSGADVRRTSRIAAIEEKQGRTGALCFVTVSHLYSDADGPVIHETQQIVFRGPSVSSTPPPPTAVASPAGGMTVPVTPVLLFRYSALTFNSHRIHYDEPYARNEEGYNGLVVHGPLQATLLLNHAARTLGARPRHFQYRGIAPLTVGGTCRVHAERRDDESLRCWTVASNGGQAMIAEARI